jgi:hypothetical protein
MALGTKFPALSARTPVINSTNLKEKQQHPGEDVGTLTGTFHFPKGF